MEGAFGDRIQEVEKKNQQRHESRYLKQKHVNRDRPEFFYHSHLQKLGRQDTRNKIKNSVVSRKQVPGAETRQQGQTSFTSANLEKPKKLGEAGADRWFFW